MPVWASAVLVVSLFVLALGYWTYHAVEGSLRELRAGTMKSLLGSEVNALRVWVAEEIGDAERIARDPRVSAALERLVRQPECSGPARERLENVLRPLLRDIGDATFNVTDRNGRLVATRFPDYCGLRLNAERFLPRLEPVFAGKSVFIPPFRDADRVALPPKLREGPPFAWIAAPVRGTDGKVIAALGIAEPVDGVFASILAAARPGETGEAFAFDERGAMLTADRFGQQTLLAGKEGVILEPYVNHKGVSVVGAAQWLPEFGMGVAIEIEAAEAYAPLRYLNIAFAVVFGALVLAVAAALGVALSVVRLRRQIGETRKAGHYRLRKLIGSGGMANIYLAQHDLLKRPTAIKLLKPTVATDEMIARFEREVQLASTLSHPNTVEIFDFGRTRDGLFYYAMEYLDGLTISEVLSKDKFISVARTLHILRQVCEALVEAHGKGLVHRDIKPENIMVCRHGGACDFVKILDFGLVKHMSGKHSRDLTRNLRILGTPVYMAPERLRNPADVDGRADIYAVGAVGFYMLTGQRLFEGSDDLGITTKVLNEAPPSLSTASPQPIPVELDLIIASCVEKKREDRPQRVTDLLEAFDALAAEHRWTQAEAEAWWTTHAPAT
ncbi:MAG TPA: serine/threonine protein kinase [Burkholderiales bacterium]